MLWNVMLVLYFLSDDAIIVNEMIFGKGKKLICLFFFFIMRCMFIDLFAGCKWMIGKSERGGEIEDWSKKNVFNYKLVGHWQELLAVFC